MKALILAGGRGDRLGRISKDTNKCMLNVKGKPLIEYSLECTVKLPISQIIIVVGYKAEDIINKYGNRYKDKTIRYVLQLEQKGLVHAIECAKEALEAEDFMLMLADEVLINPAHNEMLNIFQTQSVFGLCGVVKVENPELIKKTYATIQSEEGRIYRLIEKPSRPFTNIMGTGNCIFKNEILTYIEQTPINQKRQEKELPDLIQCAIDEGNIVKSFLICRYYININSEEELQEAYSYFTHL